MANRSPLALTCSWVRWPVCFRGPCDHCQDEVPCLSMMKQTAWIRIPLSWEGTPFFWPGPGCFDWMARTPTHMRGDTAARRGLGEQPFCWFLWICHGHKTQLLPPLFYRQAQFLNSGPADDRIRQVFKLVLHAFLKTSPGESEETGGRDPRGREVGGGGGGGGGERGKEKRRD
jgi:hypothetical protein